MTDIVLVLGAAWHHRHAINTEMDAALGGDAPKRVVIGSIHDLTDPAKFSRSCHSCAVLDPVDIVIVGYILPLDDTNDPNGENESEYSYWKRTMQDRFKEDGNVKELELRPYNNGCGKFWLDGVDQLRPLDSDWDDPFDDTLDGMSIPNDFWNS